MCKKDYKKTAEAQGWRWYESDGNVELSKHSPAGEEYVLSVCAESIPEVVRKVAEDFDKEDLVRMWLNAKNRGAAGVPDLDELVRDAEAIRAMILELADALEGRVVTTKKIYLRLGVTISVTEEKYRDICKGETAGADLIEEKIECGDFALDGNTYIPIQDDSEDDCWPVKEEIDYEF